MAVQPIPPGYHTVTPYLVMKNAGKAIEFYKKAFGATELYRMPGPGDSVMHAEVKIGDSPVMMSDEMPGQPWKGPESYGGTPVSLMIYVENSDAVFARAVEAGATSLKPVADQFYGDRAGTLKDPFGHVWTIATHKEDVPPEEIDRRFQEMMKKGGGGA